MNDRELLLKDLIGKDEIKAQNAANHLINNVDVELFSMLVEKSEYLFDFVRHNVIKRIEKAVSKDNYMNILKFLDIYSAFYDDLFTGILAKHANQNLTDDIFDMLEKGSLSQKIYAAKYFSYIPDTVALEALSKYAFSDDENLSFNSAEALGQMQDDISYDIALSLLESEDDFEKLKAVKFFTAYGRDFPLKEIFNAMRTSKMPENIAGQIPYMESLLALLNSEFKNDAMFVVDNILSGLGEILPLSDIFQFELYDVISNLISMNKQENEYSGKIAEILLAAYSKFKMFTETQEYVFDENKDTQYEIKSIYQLLQTQQKSFWDNQKEFLLKELSLTADRIIPALHIISEYTVKSAVPKLKELLISDDEIILCEVLTVLKQLNALNDVNFEEITLKIKNSNIKAIIENLKA